MARLPTPGGDTNNWGAILNDFLSVEHHNDGSLKIAPTVAGKTDNSGGGREKLSVLSNAGAAPIINLADGNVHMVTLTASISNVSITGAINGVACSVSIYLKQDTTGGRVITWPATIKWPGGIAPTLTATANAIDLIVLETLDGGATWFGALAGADYR
jgi:hypothetical protein